ncbi:hypothetical protein CLOM_g11966, partial [Closterium sp. NIES-68]
LDECVVRATNAKIATPLTNLLKKNTPYKWEPQHQEAVEQLKEALTSAPVLILPDPERDYVIEADASDQAVGAVLMQDQGNGLQPIAYLSKKLHGAELNYPIHDKEALAIIIAFKTWRCYLEGRKTTVYTDHCSLKYLKTQPSLSRRRSLITLHCASYYSKNTTTSCTQDTSVATRRSPVSPNTTTGPIWQMTYRNSSPRAHMSADEEQQAEKSGSATASSCPRTAMASGKPRLHHRLPTTTSGHDAILVVIDKFSKMGHFIPTHTTARTERQHNSFKFWKELMSLLGTKLAMSSAYHPQTDGQTERLNQIVEQLLRAACKDDISNGTCICPSWSLPTTMLLTPLLDRRRSSSVTDATHSHLNSQPYQPHWFKRNDAILIVVDRLTKMAHFAACKTTITAEQTAKLFLTNIVQLHGIPLAIISDCDPRFTFNFWTKTWQQYGTRLHLPGKSHHFENRPQRSISFLTHHYFHFLWLLPSPQLVHSLSGQIRPTLSLRFKAKIIRLIPGSRTERLLQMSVNGLHSI